MVKIRLARYGTKKRPYYRIVAADSRQARDGKFIEILGTYDPMNLSLPKDSTEKKDKGLVSIKTDRLTHWVSVGAQISPTVTSILKREKILTTPSATKAA
jgi:small subunit ribosomal protein S16